MNENYIIIIIFQLPFIFFVVVVVILFCFVSNNYCSVSIKLSFLELIFIYPINFDEANYECFVFFLLLNLFEQVKLKNIFNLKKINNK